MELEVIWKPRWYRFSRYAKAEIVSGNDGSIATLYKHKRTGVHRLYTHNKGWPLDGKTISINGETVLFRRAGYYGKLHIQRKFFNMK